MNKLIAIGFGGLLLLFLLAYNATYTVQYHQVAIKKTFGNVDEDSVITESGLHWRLPFFAEQVELFDTRLQIIESPLETIQTADGQQVVVRAFLLWQVDRNDPLTFYQRYSSMSNAEAALLGTFREALQGQLSAFSFDDLLGADSRLDEAAEAVRAGVDAVTNTQGIIAKSVGISQMVLPPRTSVVVLNRMAKSRELLADTETQRGNAEATRLTGEAQNIANKIGAFANQRATEIRAQADREATEYLNQMSVTPEHQELAIFLKWVDTLRQTLSGHTTFIIDARQEPWHLIDLQAAVNGNGIPQPPEALAFRAPGPPDAVVTGGDASTEPSGDGAGD